MASDNLSHWLISTQVRVFLLCVTGKKKQLRVVRVEPRNGRRVLINGYAIAHLGGVAFDSVTRHHDVIEIQSDDESEEDVDVKPDPEPPAKRQRAARVKSRDTSSQTNASASRRYTLNFNFVWYLCADAPPGPRRRRRDPREAGLGGGKLERDVSTGEIRGI